MSDDRVFTAEEMAAMSPDERAQIVRQGQRSSLDGLDPAFQARVRATSRRIAEEHGLLDAEQA